MSDHCAELSEPHTPALRLVRDWRGEIDMGTRLQRRFFGMGDNEPIELSIFVRGRVFVAHAMSVDHHVRLLTEAERIEGFEGSYCCFNGPAVDGIYYRYPHNEIIRWAKKRTTDKEIRAGRCIFIDWDTNNRERISGISATDAELAATWPPANECRRWLERELGAESIAFGCSGNGHFVLVAVESFAPTEQTTERIATFLEIMNKRFGTSAAKVDGTVAHPGRLMPCAGTTKAKGINSPERPHRRTTITCRPDVVRVPLEAVC